MRWGEWIWGGAGQVDMERGEWIWVGKITYPPSTQYPWRVELFIPIPSKVVPIPPPPPPLIRYLLLKLGLSHRLGKIKVPNGNVPHGLSDLQNRFFWIMRAFSEGETGGWDFIKIAELDLFLVDGLSWIIYQNLLRSITI